MSDVLCLQTKVRNISSQPLSYGYLIKLGIFKQLRSGEEASGFGNLFQMVQDNVLEAQALQRDLQAGRIAIVSVPAPIIGDPVNDTVRMLEINDGMLEHDDPCWGRYVSSGGIADGGN